MIISKYPCPNSRVDSDGENPVKQKMKCKINITAATDLPAWVTRNTFMENVDQKDLACREAREVLDWYHPEWFCHDTNGDLLFTPPAFIFSRGQLRAINGRHRAVLLFRYLEVIPMLLVKHDEWPKEKVKEIVNREITEDETIELPDLVINKALQKSDEQSIQDTRYASSSKGHFDIKINF